MGVPVTDIDKKLIYIYFNLDGLYQFSSIEEINDHSKRIILRRYFILVDNFIKLIGCFKNILRRNKSISKTEASSLKDIIKDISSVWDNQYDIIRDNFSAHLLDGKTNDIIDWWNEIDWTTLTYFHEQLSSIRHILTRTHNLRTFSPTDYSRIEFATTEFVKDGGFYFSPDRMAITKRNTAGIIPCTAFQNRCMTICSNIEYLHVCYSLALLTNTNDTYYKRILFESSLTLTCCDAISFILNLYGSTSKESLLTLAPNNWSGKKTLETGDNHRDSFIERETFELRNKFAAHIDANSQFSSLVHLFDNFNHDKLYEYISYHMNVFKESCKNDIRTIMFAMRDTKMHGDITGLSYTKYKEF